MGILDQMEGGPVPVVRKGNTYVVEMDITNEEDPEELGVWQRTKPKKGINARRNNRMDVDQDGIGEISTQWKAFWEEDMEIPF